VTRTRDVMMNICQVIAKWNVHFTYSETGIMSKTGSCQQFVQDVFHKLHIKSHYWDHSKGRIYKLLQEVKASRDKIYWPSYNGVKIKTHEQLDALYNKYYPNNRPEDTEEYEFFRALDRSYWVTGETTNNCPLLSKLDVNLCRTWTSRNFHLKVSVEQKEYTGQSYSIDINKNDNYIQLLEELKKELKKQKVNLAPIPIALKVKHGGSFIELNDIDQIKNGSEVQIYSAKANVLAKGSESEMVIDLGDEKFTEYDDENPSMGNFFS